VEDITEVTNARKCAHEQCHCLVPPTEEYCSDYCSTPPMWVKSCSSAIVGTLHAGLNEYRLIDIRGESQCRARE
jgi:hypothetical protein